MQGEVGNLQQALGRMEKHTRPMPSRSFLDSTHQHSLSTSLGLQPTALPGPASLREDPPPTLFLPLLLPLAPSFLNPSSSSKNHSLEPHLVGGSNSLSYLSDTEI